VTNARQRADLSRGPLLVSPVLACSYGKLTTPRGVAPYLALSRLVVSSFMVANAAEWLSQGCQRFFGVSEEPVEEREGF